MIRINDWLVVQYQDGHSGVFHCDRRSGFRCLIGVPEVTGFAIHVADRGVETINA